MRIEFRIAEAEDSEALYDLLLEMHDEVGLFPLAERKVRAKIALVLDEGACFVAEVDGTIVGSIGVVPEQMWYTDDFMLADKWTFVKQNWRRSRVAIGLLRRAKEFAKRAGLPLAVGVFGAKDTARKNALFGRLFTPVGEMFMEFPHVLRK